MTTPFRVGDRVRFTASAPFDQLEAVVGLGSPA